MEGGSLDAASNTFIVRLVSVVVNLIALVVRLIS